ncbi:VOC family protein [Williamsia sp. CHRR-6]|uniref:VOC family protein n=1 Tax=Williamsia sp. CHRR-6 TaxID=2835871 RepID=UPI001BDB17BA|nr:VOC family protein [Williamsia sp. CHRR-6]MBT0565520.1 VOC family protein [Williamsia sp. CHRR-6]
MPQPRVAGLSIVVTDMARALAFYRMCGVDTPASADAQPHAESVLPGGFRLMFDTVEVIRSFQPGWQAPKGGHRAALALDCGRPTEVDALHQQLVAAGHHSEMAPFDAFWGQRYAIVADPDGNPVDLFAALD